MPKTKIALAACAIAGLYWLLLFVSTHIPMKGDPNRPSNGRDDKIQHVVAFAGLAFLLCTAGAIDGRFGRALVPYVLLAIVAYAVFDETSQHYIPTRTSDLNDWVADMLGTGIGLAAFLVFVEPLLAALPRSRIPRDATPPKASASA
jgi:VanZ family protein